MEELRQEMIVFGEENAKLRLELDIVTNKYNELQEKLYEQQIKIQEQGRDYYDFFLVQLSCSEVLSAFLSLI